MKNRIERLIKLRQIKQQVTQNYYVELLKAQELLKQNQIKQEQLTAYRTEYLNQLQHIGNEGTQIGRVRNRILFINQLDEALAQLQTYLQQLSKQRAHTEELYNQAKIAESAVEKLIDKINKRQELALQKQEQKEFDEYAQKQWYSNKINDNCNFIGE